MTTVVNVSDGSEFDVYIGRPSKYGNPFIRGIDGTKEEVIAKYKEYALNNPELYNSLLELEGKRLGCYCAPKYCHGDVIVELIEQQNRESIIER